MVYRILCISGAVLFCFGKDGRCAENTPSLSEELLRPKVEYAVKNQNNPFRNYITEEAPVEINRATAVEEKISLPAFTIQGLIWGVNTPCAIVNNKVVRQGDSIDEVKISEIRKEGIDLLYKGKKFYLPSPSDPQIEANDSSGRQDE